MKKFILLIAFIVCISVHAASQCNNTGDYTALRALYLATDGDNWTNHSGWPDAATFTANPTPPIDLNMETWFGVECQIFRGGPSDRVRYIDIDDNNLNGSLPVEIGEVTSLFNLRLNDNSITGDLSTLSSLSLLNTIDLSYTNVTGNLSSLSSTQANIIVLAGTNVFGDLSSLEPIGGLDNVDLENTNVEGDIALFESMSALVELNLNNTNVTGDISSLNGILSLGDLELSNTDVSGNLNDLILSNSLYVLKLENLNLTGCWSPYLESLCDVLWMYNFEGNQGVISNQGWLGFCDNGAGMCPPCPDNIKMVCLAGGGCSLLSGVYEAKDTVNYDNGYYILAGEDVTLNGGVVVSMTNGFEVRSGGVLQIESDGCVQD